MVHVWGLNWTAEQLLQGRGRHLVAQLCSQAAGLWPHPVPHIHQSPRGFRPLFPQAKVYPGSAGRSGLVLDQSQEGNLQVLAPFHWFLGFRLLPNAVLVSAVTRSDFCLIQCLSLLSLLPNCLLPSKDLRELADSCNACEAP